MAPRREITGHLHNHEALHDANVHEYEIALDQVNADPTNPRMRSAAFLAAAAPPTRLRTDRQRRTWNSPGCFCRSTTLISRPISPSPGCTDLHVLGGVIVFIYLWLPIGDEALQAQSGAPRQPGRGGRTFLALCRSGLDFRFSALLSALTMDETHEPMALTWQPVPRRACAATNTAPTTSQNTSAVI